MTAVTQTNQTSWQSAAYLAQAAAANGSEGTSFSSLLTTGSGNGATGNAANSAAAAAISAASEAQSSEPPPIPEGQRWYVRPTGRYAGGAEVYTTPLGELGRSPAYGNWFIRYGNSPSDGTSIAPTDETGNMVAMATTNFVPSYREVWNMFQEAGMSPAWGVQSKQIPAAMNKSENAGFTDPQKALNKISEWRQSGDLWEAGFALPELNMPELPEGSDHPLLRELSQELRRVVADTPASQQADMVALLQQQGYSDFLPGGRWFTPASGGGEDPFAAEAALAVSDPWNPGVRWQDNPADWRNQVASAEWADNQIPGPAQWGTRFVNPSAAAGWVERALDTGAFWTGINLPRYAPVTDPASQQAVNGALDWDMTAGEKQLKAAIGRAISEAPEARKQDLTDVFVRQGFDRFLETEAPAMAATVAPAAAAAPAPSSDSASTSSSAASSSAASSAAASSSAASSAASSSAAAASASPAPAAAAAPPAASTSSSSAAASDPLADALTRLTSANPELAANFQQASSLLAALAAQTERLQSAFARTQEAAASYSSLALADGESLRGLSA